MTEGANNGEGNVVNKFSKDNCIFCKEALLEVGKKTEYGAVIIYKVGSTKKDGWFAILSPRTGGDPKSDFSIQIVPFGHLTNFSQIDAYPELARNYGIIFSKVSSAVGVVIKDELPDGEERVPIGTYGKCKHLDEHIHIKIFPWRNDIGQPFTTDSSFQRKEIFKDAEEEFVKMKPVRKAGLKRERFDQLSEKLISLLK